MPPIDRMAASPSADWKAAASEARTAFPSSRWPATWVARSTVAAGCVLPLITRRAASSAVGGGRDVEGDAVTIQAAAAVHSMAATFQLRRPLAVQARRSEGSAHTNIINRKDRHCHVSCCSPENEECARPLASRYVSRPKKGKPLRSQALKRQAVTF